MIEPDRSEELRRREFEQQQALQEQQRLESDLQLQPQRSLQEQQRLESDLQLQQQQELQERQRLESESLMQQPLVEPSFVEQAQSSRTSRYWKKLALTLLLITLLSVLIMPVLGHALIGLHFLSRFLILAAIEVALVAAVVGFMHKMYESTDNRVAIAEEGNLAAAPYGALSSTPILEDPTSARRRGDLTFREASALRPQGSVSTSTSGTDFFAPPQSRAVSATVGAEHKDKAGKKRDTGHVRPSNPYA